MPMEYTIARAIEQDKQDILALYKAQIGREFCPWDDDYPSEQTIEFDMSRDALFVMKEDGVIKAAISIDDDEEVEKLECWSRELKPVRELSRLAVATDAQNRGLARIMLRYAMDELRRMGCKGVHFLVNKYNIKAIRSYEVLDFNIVGECYMHDQDYYCYEKEL